MSEKAIRREVINSDDYPFTFSAMLGFLLGLGALAEFLGQLFNI